MRTAFVCLLSVVLAPALAQAAPAPFANPRDVKQPLSVECVTQQLVEQYGITAESIERRGWSEWVVVTRITLRGRCEGIARDVRQVYLVKCQGKDDKGRPLFALTELEHLRHHFR
jgi:hypothetical protein